MHGEKLMMLYLILLNKIYCGEKNEKNYYCVIGGGTHGTLSSGMRTKGNKPGGKTYG